MQVSPSLTLSSNSRKTTAGRSWQFNGYLNACRSLKSLLSGMRPQHLTRPLTNCSVTLELCQRLPVLDTSLRWSLHGEAKAPLHWAQPKMPSSTLGLHWLQPFLQGTLCFMTLR